jgi:hypothetical protein
MKSHAKSGKIRLLVFPIIFITVLLTIIISSPFARTSVLAQGNAGGNALLCFMQTKSGNVINLERLCGTDQTAGANKTGSPIVFKDSSRQTEQNLAWVKQHPSGPVANAPSPYSAEGITEFNKLLYGD